MNLAQAMTVAHALAVQQIATARARHMLRGADVHIDRQPGMTRKRVQPRGNRDCMGCGRTISANKSHCASCAKELTTS